MHHISHGVHHSIGGLLFELCVLLVSGKLHCSGLVGLLGRVASLLVSRREVQQMSVDFARAENESSSH